MAFGDSLNDRSMMKEAKYSIAMQNSDPELLTDCCYQIGTNNEQAVIALLEQIIENPTLDLMVNYQIARGE